MTNNFRTILSEIPDSVEVLGFEESFFDHIPMTKFPKSLNKLYMNDRASSLYYSFENHDIYTSIDNNIEEYRTEEKRGEDPLSCMYKDYFHSKITEYKKSNEYWDEYWDLVNT